MIHFHGLTQDLISITLIYNWMADTWSGNFTSFFISFELRKYYSYMSGSLFYKANAPANITPGTYLFLGVISFVAEDEDQQQSQHNSSPEKTDGEQALQKLSAETPQTLDVANMGMFGIILIGSLHKLVSQLLCKLNVCLICQARCPKPVVNQIFNTGINEMPPFKILETF